ncbi:MAG: TolC family protein [Gemmataceae bacterium]|nr:TolC family protein [Gemmataceae bacterium]
MRYLTSSVLGLVAVAAVVVALSGGSTAPAPAADKAKADDPVRALQKERLTRLETIHEWSLQAYKGRQLPLDQVLSARLALLGGKLDLCETNAERVKVHEEMVKAVEEQLKVVRERADAKEVPALEVLKAEVQLLDARIGSEKAKAAK